MDIKMLIKAKQLFNTDAAPAYINRHNQRQWARSIKLLGSKWILASPVKKLEKPVVFNYTTK